jgi:hypothetical protein
MDYFHILLLAATAGFTIFLGLSLSIFQNISASKKRLYICICNWYFGISFSKCI